MPCPSTVDRAPTPMSVCFVDIVVTSRGQGRLSCMKGGQAADSSTGSNGHRAARFSDCETGDDDDDDDDEDDDVDYSTSSSDDCSVDDLDARRRSRRSQGERIESRSIIAL